MQAPFTSFYVHLLQQIDQLFNQLSTESQATLMPILCDMLIYLYPSLTHEELQQMWQLMHRVDEDVEDTVDDEGGLADA